MPAALVFRNATNNASPAGSGVADGENRNWLNGVGDPAPGCDPVPTQRARLRRKMRRHRKQAHLKPGSTAASAQKA